MSDAAPVSPLRFDATWTVLCGAGILIPPPTSLNAAAGFSNALRDVLVAAASVPEERIDAALLGGRDGLRFEQVVSILSEVDPDLRCLDYLLVSELGDPCPAPNDLHHWIADGLTRGASVVTTNFDVMIELAVHERSAGRPDRDAALVQFHKPHGSIQRLDGDALVRAPVSS